MRHSTALMISALMGIATCTWVEAANTKLTAPTTTLSSTSAGGAADYSLKCKTANRNGSNIIVNALVTFTFPAGTNAATVNTSTSTFAGTLIPAASFVTVTATKIQFKAPVAVNKGTSFTTVLKGITNPATPGSYTASIVAVNSSGGNDTGNNIFTYTIVPGAAHNLLFKVQPSNSISGAQIFPAVQVIVQDTNGNTVTTNSDNITISINSGAGGALSGTLTVPAIKGVATFTNLIITGTAGAYTLKATDALLPVTFVNSASFNVSASSANRVVFTVQPPASTAAGVAMSPSIKVTIQDFSGNPVTTATNAISIAIETNPAGGTLAGTATVNAVNGVATFSNLSIDKAAAGYSISASSAGMLSCSSNLFTITAGAAAQVGFIVQPTDATAGDSVVSPNPIAPTIQAAVQDAFGNLVTSDNATQITLTIASNPGSSTLSGTLTQTVSGGIASFSNVNINKGGNGYTLSAGATGLASATSTTFNVIADNASQIVFSVQPVNTQQTAQIFPAVQVALEDPEGNVDLTATDTITISFGNNPGNAGTLSGTLSINAVNGIASFGDLAIDKAATGYTLSAADAAFTSVTSNAFNITTGTTNHLTFLGQPSNIAAGTSFVPTIQVAVFNNAGATVAGDNSTQVTLAIGSNPGGGTLTGTLTQTVFNGIATFSNVSVTRSGAGYTLTVSSNDGTLPSTSSAFTVGSAGLHHFAFGAIGAQTAGNAFNASITAQDANNNTVTSYVGPVQITSSGTLLGAPITSASFTSGVLIQPVTVTSVQASTTLTATDASSGKFGTSGTFAVTAGALNNFLVEASGGGAIATQTAGTAFGIQLTARDAYNNTATTFNSPVQLISTNATLAGSPVNTTNLVNGFLNLPAGVTINSAQSGTTITCSGLGVLGTSNAFLVQNAPPQFKLAFNVQPSNTQAGASIFPAIQVAINDQFGNLVASATDTVTISIGNNPGASTLSGTVSVAAIGGIATFSNLSLNLTGTGYTLNAAAASCSNSPLASSAFNISASTGNHLSFVVQPGSANAGSSLTPALQVAVKDINGNTVTTATDNVTLSIATGTSGAVLSGTLSRAAVNGIATFPGLSINLAGAYTLSASSATVPSNGTSSAFSINPAGLDHFLVEAVGGGAIATQSAGTAFNIQITAQDVNNNTVSSVTGPVRITSNGTLSGSPVTSGTFSNGVLSLQSVTITSAQAGTTLTATDPATSKTGVSATFTVSPGALASFLVQSTTGGSIGAQTAGTAFNVKLTAVDALGNTVTGFVSTVQLSSSGTLAGAPLTSAAFVSGVLASQAVTINSTQSATTVTAFTSGKSGTSNAFVVNPGVATQVAFIAQPSSVQLGASIFPSVQVAIEDAQGNVVTSSNTLITISKASGPAGGNLAGLVGIAATNGIATFGNLSLSQTGTYTLGASDGTHSTTSSSFVVTSSTANHLVFTAQPSTASSGASIAPAVQVSVANSLGATVSADNSSVVTIAIENNPGSGTLSGTLSATVSSGVATFSNLSIDKVGTSYTLAASAPGLSSGSSSTFNIAPATVTHFLVEAAGGGSIPAQTAGAAFNIRITALDGSNNVDSSFNGTVNMTSTGTLSQGSGTTASFVSGVLSSWSVAISNTGNFTLTATRTSGGAQSGTSNAFSVSSGPLDHFLVENTGGGAIPTQTAGSAFNLRIKAQDVNNNTVSSFSGTVQLTSNAALTGAPVTSGSFTSGVLDPQSVTITSAQSGTIVTATASGKMGSSAGFTVTSGALDHFQVEAAGGGSISTQAAGTAFSIRITAQDVFNNTVPAFNGTVQITSNATLSGAPVTSASFTSGLLASQNVTINSVQAVTTLTATDLVSTKTGTCAAFAVTPGPVNNFLVEANGGGAIGTQTAGAAFAIQITARDVANNTATSFNGTVQLSSSGTLVGAPVTSAAFTNGVLTGQSVTVTSAQAGTTLSAAASGASGSSAAFTVNPAALNSFLVEQTGGGSIAPQAANVAFNLRITAQDAFANTVTGFSGNVNITSSGTLSGSPLSSGAFTLGVLASQSVTITLAQGSVTLTATDPVSTKSGTSAPFSVAGAAAGLSFSVQPSTTQAGSPITPAVKVAIVDALGSIVPTSTNSISIAIASNSGGGTLSGTTTAAAVGGVASFANLSIDRIGAGYTLQASATGLTSATSAAFTVSNAAAPVIQSPLTSSVSAGTVGQPVQFTFSASSPLGLTYTFDFGDGTTVSGTSTTVTHTYTLPGTYTIKATATDLNGVATTSTISLQVVAGAVTPGGLCDGLNPIALGATTFKASVRFPSPSGKDSIGMSSIIQLKAGFAPSGQVVSWTLAGISGTATLDAKGNFSSGGIKVSIKFKKPAKGAAFAGGPGKLSIAMKNQSFSTLTLNNVPTLSVDSKGTAATVDLCVLLKDSQAYQKLGGAGTYKAKKGKNGTFSGKF